MYEEELKAKKEKLISDLNEYVLTARGYINDSKVQKEVTLKKGKFHVKNATEGSKIQALSEDEKLILAYEASKSEKKRYDSNILKNILEIKRRIFLFGSKENVIENIEKEVEEIQKSTRIITKRTKKTFLQMKKEQIQMLKDKETRADGVALLLGVVGFGDDYIETQEEVEHVLSKEEETTLKKLNLLLNLINGGTKKFVEEQLISEIENKKMNAAGPEITGINNIGVDASVNMQTKIKETIEPEEKMNVEVDAHIDPQIQITETIEPEEIIVGADASADIQTQIKETIEPEKTNLGVNASAKLEKTKAVFIPQEEVSEEELNEAFDILAEAEFRIILNTESIDDVIKFLKKNEIEAKIDDKKYKLLYKKPKDSKGKIDSLENLKKFYIQLGNGHIKPADFTIIDIIMLSDAINTAEFEEKQSEYSDEKINAKILIDKFFTSMIEAKTRWLEFYHDEEKITESFKDEIKTLKEKSRLSKNNLNELMLLKDLINQKELSLEIATGKRAKAIIEREKSQLKPALIEGLTELNYIDTSKTEEIPRDMTDLNEKSPEVISQEEVSEEELQKAFDSISIASANTIMDKKSVDTLIKFVKTSKQDIVTKLDGKKYKLIYKEQEPQKGKSDNNIKLSGLYFEMEDGTIQKAYINKMDSIIFSNLIHESQKSKGNNLIGEREITTKEEFERMLASVIECKNKWIENNKNINTSKQQLEAEIKKLNEFQIQLTKEQNELNKPLINYQKYLELKFIKRRLKDIQKIINRKQTTIKILTGEAVQEIISEETPTLKETIKENLKATYNKTCNEGQENKLKQEETER